MTSLAILGHSFVQGTEKHLQGRYPELTGPHGCSTSLDLDKLVSEVYLLGQRGATLQQYSQNMYCIPASLLDRVRPSYAIVDLGTNDLASGSAPHQVATSVVNFATSLIRTYGIRHVTVCQIVSRHACIGRLTPARFADLANKTNQHLVRMCDGEESLSFHAHEGLTDRKKHF